MRWLILCAVGALALVSDATADEGKGGPPPGKGWRKNEVPTAPSVPPKPAPAPEPKAKGKPVPVPVPPVAKKPDGIGPQVSAWARSGIHGRELAARVHQLQAERAKAAPAPAPPTAKPVELKKGPPKKQPKGGTPKNG